MASDNLSRCEFISRTQEIDTNKIPTHPNIPNVLLLSLPLAPFTDME